MVTGSMLAARSHHTATLLADGRVLVTGGGNLEDAAELYDPVAGSWARAGACIRDGASGKPTLLLDGRVLVAGGSTGDGGLVLATAELYDPQLGSWAPTGSMNEAHYSHTATLLADGRVLVTGGSGWSQFMGSSELYDPTSGTWTATGGLIDARLGHTASLLPDGTVLVAGGIGDGGCCGLALRSAEIYEPGTGTWAQGAWMAQGRGRHSATTLADGAVLVAGGRDDGDHVLASAEIYDARRAVWTPAASMERARSSHTATLLPDGAVLLAGGVDDDDLLQVDIRGPTYGTLGRRREHDHVAGRPGDSHASCGWQSPRDRRHRR